MGGTVLHYPRLDTIIMVEDVIKKSNHAISKSELLRKLPKQVMRQTLNVILDYLEEKRIILIGNQGILWIYKDRPKMKNNQMQKQKTKQYLL